MIRRVPLAAVALVALAVSPSHAAGATDFAPAIAYPTAPGGGSSVAVANLDGDAHEDLVVTNNIDGPYPDINPGTVSVLLGRAGGRFAQPAVYPVGLEPNAVAVADFNGDVNPDVVVVNTRGDDVSVLLGQGGGELGEQVTYPVGHMPHSVAVGDFNADTNPDLVTTGLDYVYGGPGTISVLLGRADGSFGAQTVFPAGVQPVSVAVGDFDGDTDPDLVVANEVSTNISVLLGQPGGSFGDPTEFTVGTNPTSVAVGDFNGDGDPDLAVTNQHDVSPYDNISRISVLLGESGGSFGPQTKYPVGIYPSHVAVGDFNGDGDPDLAVTHSGTGIYTGPQVSVLLGGEGGRFGTPSAFSAPAYSLATGDLNGDAYADLAVGGPRSVSVLLHAGAAWLAPWSHRWKDPRPDSVKSPWRTVTLTNLAASALTATQATLAGTDPASFRLLAGGCTGAVLATGESCEVSVRFRPDGTGPKSAWIEFADDAAGSPRLVFLSGIGVAGPWLTTSLQGLKFGYAGVGAGGLTRSLTLTNTGSAPMSVTGFSLDGTNPGDFTVTSENCTALASLGPDESCTAEVGFSPSAVGLRTARLAIADNAPSNPHLVTLRGHGR